MDETRPAPDLSRIFAFVGLAFGGVFVLVNAPGLSGPWRIGAYVVGAGLLLAALRRTFAARQASAPVVGSPRIYWIAVGAEVLAIPLGSLVLNKVVDEPDLVVLWVVFVVGAHFLPARLFRIGHYFELGLVLMALAVAFGIAYLSADADWAPSAGGVLAGLALLANAAT